MNKLIPVPYLDQSRAAPTGCESVTAVMLLHFLGVPMEIRDFIDGYLDKGPLYTENGQLYGSDPNLCFVGDPYDPEAMGCYAPVIRRALERVLGDSWDVRDETGREIDSLTEEYIFGLDMPVVLWATINLRPAVDGPAWLLPDGRSFLWRSNEHCMLLLGQEEDDYILNDPWDNNGQIRCPKALLRQRHREQGMRAVGVRRREKHE